MNDTPPLMTWQPALRVFVGRTVFVTGLTTGVFSVGLLFHPITSLFELAAVGLGFAIACAFYAFVFDEHLIWMRSRDDRWVLRDDALIYQSAFDDADHVVIPLHQIASIKRWFWWALRIKITGGPKIVMYYLPDTRSIRSAILAQQAAILERSH